MEEASRYNPDSNFKTDVEGLMNNFALKFKAAKTKKQQVNLLSLLPGDWSYAYMKRRLKLYDVSVPVSRTLWNRSREILSELGPMPDIRPEVIKIHCNALHLSQCPYHFSQKET